MNHIRYLESFTISLKVSLQKRDRVSILLSKCFEASVQ